MREGGRFIKDGKGELRKVAPTIGSGKDEKPNPEHHEYPPASEATNVGAAAAGQTGNDAAQKKG